MEVSLRNQNRTAFRLLDTKRERKITYEKLRRTCLQLGENFTEHEMQCIFHWADKDKDGVLNEDEFVDALTPAK